jgi:hypothetical protein
MTRIKNHSIYKLPHSDVSYAAYAAGDGRFFLYPCVGGATNPPSFIINPDGRVQPWLGNGTEWEMKDLIDTGQTYRFSKDFKCP